MNKSPFPSSVIGVDLETSALDPREGTIIEIAALRFDTATGEIIDSFEQLCRPTAPLNPEVIALTGLTNEQLADKPLFSEIKDTAKVFLGEDILFAHNASFDIGWLDYHGVELTNPVWDTFMLAHIAWPQADSYNLGALTAMLNLKAGGEHRAGEDVKATWPLLPAIREQLAVSPQTYKKIAHILAASGQAHYLPLFTEALKKTSTKKKTAETPVNTSYPPGEKITKQLLKQKGIAALKIPLGHSHTSFYLKPLQEHAKSHKAVIAAASRRFHNHLEALLPSSASLKERRHYICSYRLDQVTQQAAYNPRAIWPLLKALIASDSDGVLDIERLNLSHLDTSLLDLASAESLVCRQHCSQDKQKKDVCGYQIALAAAQESSLIIVRQAALLSEEFLADQPLGNIDTLVMEEADRLPQMATYASQLNFSSVHVAEILSAFAQKSAHADTLPQLLADYQRLLALAKGYVMAAEDTNCITLTTSVRRHASWQAWLKEGSAWLNRFKVALGLYRSQAESADEIFQRAAETLVTQFAEFLKGSPDRIQAVRYDQRAERVELYDAPSDSLSMIHQGLLPASRVIFISSFPLEYPLPAGSKTTDFPEEDKKYTNSLLLYVAQDNPDSKAEGFAPYVAESINLLAKPGDKSIFCFFTSKKLIRQVYRELIRILNKEKISLLAEGETGGRANILRKLKDAEGQPAIILGTRSLLEAISEAGISPDILCLSKLPFPWMDDPTYQFLKDKHGSYKAFERFMIPHLIHTLREVISLTLSAASSTKKLKLVDPPRKMISILDRRLIEKGYGQHIRRELAPPAEASGGLTDLPKVAEAWFAKTAIAAKKPSSKKE